MKIFYFFLILFLLLNPPSIMTVVGKKKPEIQVFFNHGGYVMVDGDLVENGSILIFKVGSNVTFGALPTTMMLFNDFHHGGVTVTVNPYFLIVDQDVTVWCVFRPPSFDEAEDPFDLTDEISAVILFLLISLIFAGIKKIT